MQLGRLIPGVSLKSRNLKYWLNLIFALFFILPVAGFGYFGYKYGILHDAYLKPFLLGVLVYTLVGFSILRRFFEIISRISREITAKVSSDLQDVTVSREANELHNLVRSFAAVDTHLRKTGDRLNRRNREMTILKELADFSYLTRDADEVLYVTLERALELSRSDVGSILLLDKHGGQEFVVRASIGHDGTIQPGDRLDFESSIAKFAVITKAPLVIKDIEKETRFGRANRARYGTKSFICMPIKTINEIVGVVTISRREQTDVYSEEEASTLTPLLSIAAFTYENILQQRLVESKQRWLTVFDRIAGLILSGGYRSGEQLRAILQEIQTVIPFGTALVLKRDRNRVDSLCLVDVMGEGPEPASGRHLRVPPGSATDRALKQENVMLLSPEDERQAGLDRELFGEEPAGYWILLPLAIGGAVAGMAALRVRSAQVFHDHRLYLEQLARMVALAVEEGRLSAAVARRDRELDTIRQIGRALASSTFDLNRVLHYTMDMIQELMNVEAGTLSLVSGNELHYATGFNLLAEINMELLGEFRLKFGQGIAGSVAARGETMLVNDTARCHEFYREIDEYLGYETRSAICVPIISQGRVVGVIEVLNKLDGEFGANDEDLLQSVAASVSIAIENARLYEETVSMAEQERSIRQMFQKFVPKQIVDKIIHDSEFGREAMEELKTLTLLNIDIRGFSDLGRQIGPQKTVALLNRFFSVMGGIVFKHKGIVDKYLGDGFLAVFGAPVSSTRDADNAIAAALEMQQSVDEISREFIEEVGSPISIGISIHTGEVVVGNIGFERKMDYTVIGDAVNAVFRLQERTKSFENGILLAENTRRASRSSLEVRELQEPLGGMRVFELLGQKAG